MAARMVAASASRVLERKTVYIGEERACMLQLVVVVMHGGSDDSHLVANRPRNVQIHTDIEIFEPGDIFPATLTNKEETPMNIAC